MYYVEPWRAKRVMTQTLKTPETLFLQSVQKYMWAATQTWAGITVKFNILREKKSRFAKSRECTQPSFWRSPGLEKHYISARKKIRVKNIKLTWFFDNKCALCRRVPWMIHVVEFLLYSFVFLCIPNAFLCIPIVLPLWPEYKGIQGKSNYYPRHARQSARLPSENHANSIFFTQISFLAEMKCFSRPGDRQNDRWATSLDLARP